MCMFDAILIVFPPLLSTFSITEQLKMLSLLSRFCHSIAKCVCVCIGAVIPCFTQFDLCMFSIFMRFHFRLRLHQETERKSETRIPYRCLLKYIKCSSIIKIVVYFDAVSVIFRRLYKALALSLCSHWQSTTQSHIFPIKCVLQYSHARCSFSKRKRKQQMIFIVRVSTVL